MAKAWPVVLADGAFVHAVCIRGLASAQTTFLAE